MNRKALAGIIGGIVLAFSAGAQAQVAVTNGYLDTLYPNDGGPSVDVGALGGGLDSNPSIRDISIDIARATNGRIGGAVRGVFFATGIPQSGGMNPGNAQLDPLFDASSQLIRVTDLPNYAGTFELSDQYGPPNPIYAPDPGQPNPDWVTYGASNNFPPRAGGSAAVWSVPLGGDSNPSPTIYDGPIFYDFFVSADGLTEYDPGLEMGNKYVITALVGNASGGAVTFGAGPGFSEPFGVFESQDDLFASPFPVSGASPISEATLLTSVVITVVPEPAGLGLLAIGALAMLRRRSK